ncbi:hypothetical protein AUR64_19210 [Haloprofundus marisrubri]|uniref:ArsR family transcriptional regulator n=1 Tax=Haloprofundus marisrubri TaxID=1514971 RepID=A0A0W1R540_9EURY|nr:hypothetical protein [Haloprofundus marisrubri]KTG08363.1 hypothetical protein AUR64_19210 [Haloprofundus marisrubri]
MASDGEDPTSERAGDDSENPTASDAFARLGNEMRLHAIRTVAEADHPPTFTDLFEASDADTTAGFAYHLRQLSGHYVEKVRETYRLTYAGRQVARALPSGEYTRRIDRDPESFAGACPVCDAETLTVAAVDNHVSVACTDCETNLLTLPFPPSGVRDRPTEELLAAFDSYHRRRLALVGDGVCPDCAGSAVGRIEYADPEAVPNSPADADADSDDADDEAHARPTLAIECERCPFEMSVPVTLGVVDHSEVVAFYADHGERLADRPLWNLGSEWREAVLSADPWCVRVTTRLDDEELQLLVGDGPTVVDVERRPVDAAETSEVDAPDADEPVTTPEEPDSATPAESAN